MNRVELSHEDPAMIVRAKAAAERGEFLQEFIPCPQELKDTVSGFSSDPDEGKRIKEQTELNLKTHGYANWYDFCVGEWGTKWDISAENGVEELGDGSIEFTFDSAWSPPIAAYDRLIEQGFTVRASYYEPGMCFCGIYVDGEDDYHHYSDMSADEVAEAIPSELDDEYGISDSMREWEEENEDEE
jgi:hypothetical protein